MKLTNAETDNDDNIYLKLEICFFYFSHLRICFPTGQPFTEICLRIKKFDQFLFQYGILR